jgi:hypothetical protein
MYLQYSMGAVLGCPGIVDWKAPVGPEASDFVVVDWLGEGLIENVVHEVCSGVIHQEQHGL